MGAVPHLELMVQHRHLVSVHPHAACPRGMKDARANPACCIGKVLVARHL
eukprot:CAMPEP_0185763516 /NCGR_PEP_ID=MMETSP1174-20130828/22455_1 /TAXON_ID=35687 /ORGANISM="Dictyocha speculum, Strain CCMP1381" /LENGTH=49 /DNA_ID=CAMNT_0028445669 /DNA_START=287 /DNA_END=436 /DNA_ORIENTATION=-